MPSLLVSVFTALSFNTFARYVVSYTMFFLSHSLFFSAAFISVTIAAPTTPASRFTFFDLQTPLAAPCDLNTGPDGEIYASTFLADKLVYIDRTSSNPNLTEITIPYNNPSLPFALLPPALKGAGSCVVQPGGPYLYTYFLSRLRLHLCLRS